MLHLARQAHFSFHLRKSSPKGKLIRAIRSFWFILIYCYSSDHHGVAAWRISMTVTWWHALETRNDRKGFGIWVFSHNRRLVLKHCLCFRALSVYPGVREYTASTSLPAKKNHKKTKHFKKLCSESDLMFLQMTTILVSVPKLISL